MNYIGLKQGTVRVIKYNSKWKSIFDKEKKLLLKSFPKNIIDVSHGGSTAIPGLFAKPIIDMFATIHFLSDVEKLKLDLGKMGYEYKGEQGVPGRILYVKGSTECRTHHLQFVLPTSDQWKNHILLKKYYIRHPKIAEEYSKLKIYLAKKFPKDRKSYTNSKDSFIKSIIDKAKKEMSKGIFDIEI